MPSTLLPTTYGHVEDDGVRGIVEGNGRSVEPRWNHSNGAWEQEVHHETRHQQAHSYRDGDIQLPAKTNGRQAGRQADQWEQNP